MISKYLFSSLRSKTFSESLPYLEQCNFNQNNKTAILMMNLGGPNKSDEISPFLVRFFQDTTVIRIPFGLGPYIAKLRGPAKINNQYNKIGGYSPLLKWTQLQGSLIKKEKDVGYLPAFRYGLPLQEDAIEYAFEQTQGKITKFILFSQYPQYSCSTGGNAIRNALQLLQQYKLKYNSFEVQIIDKWHTNQYYIKALAAILKDEITNNKFNPQETLILFTAHSLPADFVWEGDKYPFYIYESCSLTIQELKKNGINIQFDLSFQSKVGLNKWLKPSTEHTFTQRIKNSQFKNIIISPMGFTSDHLETLYELDLDLVARLKPEAQKLGKSIVRGASLNDHPLFIDALTDLVNSKQQCKGRKVRCVDCKFEECNIVNTHSL